MNFQNLTEGACGEDNSLAQFSRHMVQDVARQDGIGHPSRSSGLTQNNVMPPQSFRVRDLMNEIEAIEPQISSRSSGLTQNNFMPPQSSRVRDLMNKAETIEPQRSFIPAQHSTSLLDSPWPTEYNEYQENRGYSSVKPATSFHNVNMMCSRDQPPWNIGLPNPQVPLLCYPQHNFEPQFEENSEYLCNESRVVVHSLDQLDDTFQREEQNEPHLEDKVQHDTELKPVSQKYWNGIPIYYESRLEEMLASKPETYTFYTCLKDYGEKSNDEEWTPPNPNQRHNPERINKRDKIVPFAEEYPYLKINPMRHCDDPFTIAKQEFFKDDVEDAIYYADEAARQNPEDIIRWRFLQHIYQTELRRREALSAAKQVIRLDPTHTMAHNTMTIGYLESGSHYEAFETMVHWMQNHKSYGDIPLNFSMVENLSRLDGSAETWINENQHIINGVKNMLLTAARRNPTNADLPVQSFLAHIFCFIMEYDKSADCLTTIARSAEKKDRHPNSCYNAGLNLFFAGKPHEALGDLLIGVKNSEKKLKDITNELIGVIYMYLTNYREAIRYFKKVLKIDPLDEEFALPNSGDILKAENELCLKLYSKVYYELHFV